jgi:adenylyltransferase/sulfurtransferase
VDSEPFRIDPAEVADDRFSRFRLLTWWDQERIRKARIVVVGAGALGNEILKNLALLGFERVVVVDSDHIELSNLSRSVLYREADIGHSKAETAAAAYRRLYDRAQVAAITANLLYDVGVGLFDWADIVLAGLDNREARLWINRCSWDMGRPWIDGAIEGLSGLARVFLPGRPPCYECTLGEADWRLLNRRMSCSLLTRSEMEAGKMPTTPTTAAVIAGIQVQEALKLLHALPVLESKAFVFDGMGHTSYVVSYTENPECFGHHSHERVIRLERRSTELSLDGLLAIARAELGADDVVLEFSREIIHKLVCPACGAEEELFVPVGTVHVERARCARDGATRAVVATHGYTGAESYGGRKLTELGLPLWDVFVARAAEREVAFLMAGDAPAVVGPLAARDGAAA